MPVARHQNIACKRNRIMTFSVAVLIHFPGNKMARYEILFPVNTSCIRRKALASSRIYFGMVLKAKELILSQRAILAHWRKQAIMLIDHSECHCAFRSQLLESSDLCGG